MYDAFLNNFARKKHCQLVQETETLANKRSSESSPLQTKMVLLFLVQLNIFSLLQMVNLVVDLYDETF